MAAMKTTLLLVLIIALVVQSQVHKAEAQSCSDSLGNLNVCAPFVMPSAPNRNPNPECCGALQSIRHDCLCNTLRIASRLPTQCNLPPLSCPAN